MSIPIGIVSALVVALVYLSTNYNYVENKICSCVFFELITVCIVFVFISIYYIAKSLNNLLKGHSYKRISPSLRDGKVLP